MAQEEQGMSLHLGLKSEQEQSHVAAGTQAATSAECPDSPAPSWPHCLTGARHASTGCWGR